MRAELQALLARLRAWPRPTYTMAHGVFRRLLAIIYAIAFLSLWVQIDGLIGARGLLPVAEFVTAVKAYATAHDRPALFLAPTLSLAFPADAALHAQCAAGILCAILLFLGRVPTLAAALLWMLYLSLTVAGQTFLGFQWENLLLETGLLAICLPATPARWLIVWLLFRLMLQSGLVKLASDDDVWWNLGALACHYWTQPLPPWTAYYANLFPAWFQKLSVLFTYLVELILPFFIWGPRLFRRIAAAGFIGLMVLIAVTGNYTYFNLLTASLAVLLLDDACWPAHLRTRFCRTPPAAAPSANPTTSPPTFPLATRLRAAAALALALVILPLSWLYLQDTLARFGHVLHRRAGWTLPIPPSAPGPLVNALLATAGPFRSINSYGLFANMTEARPELIVEGSADGQSWIPYEFRWKPGALDRRPPFVQPHQPRLDWQMWFAALGELRGNPWLIRLLDHLLHGTPDVLALLATNPFPDTPPHLVRIVAYDYTFTTPAERSRTGHWWTRSAPRAYSPVLTLHGDRLAVVTDFPAAFSSP